MARSFSYWIPLKALLHGILAVVLSFIAYSKRIKGEYVHNFSGICSYPSSSAWFYGMFAAIALLLGQLTISIGTRCFCCRGRGVRFSSKCPIVFSIIFFILSWLSFVISFIGLIYTSVVNNRKYLVKHYSSNNSNGESCFIGKENLFLGAAVWCIITTVFGLMSYAFWACGTTNRNNDAAANYGHGVAMGQLPHTQLSKEQC